MVVGVVVVVEQAAADVATRLPVSILQTLLATEELTIPGPKVDDDQEHRGVHGVLVLHVRMRARHHLSTRSRPRRRSSSPTSGGRGS